MGLGKNWGVGSGLVRCGETSAENAKRSRVKPDYVLEAVRDIPDMLM